MASEEQPFSPVVGAVLTQMFNDSANVTNSLIENYQRQIKQLTAELAAIRSGMNDLLNGPYAPSAAAIEQVVFYPRKALIEQYMEASDA